MKSLNKNLVVVSRPKKARGKKGGGDDHITVGSNVNSSHSLQARRMTVRVVQGFQFLSVIGSGSPLTIHLNYTPTSGQQQLWEEYVVEKATLQLCMGSFTSGIQGSSFAICYDPVSFTPANAGQILNHNDGCVECLTVAKPIASYTVHSPSHPVLGSILDSVTGITETRQPVRIDQTWNCGHFYIQNLETVTTPITAFVEYTVSLRHPRVDG